MRGNDKASYDAASIKITSEAGDLYQSDNTLKNMFLYTPDVDRANLRASVKVEGLPINEGGKWDTASFILLAGEDDYYTIGKKSHFAGFATVKERAQAASEVGGDAAHNAVTTAWLGIVKVGNEIKLEYSLDGTTWATAETYTDATFGNDYQLGFGTWTSTNTGRVATFSEFKVGTADQTYADLTAVDIMTVAKEEAPDQEASDVFVAFGTEVVSDGTVEEAAVSIPKEIKKIEMTYAFKAGNVQISQNGKALDGTFANTGAAMLEVADGDVIVVTNGDKAYTFTIKCVEENVTTVEKIAAAAMGFEVAPKDEIAFFPGETFKKTGTLEVTVAEDAGTVDILYGNLREALEVKKDGNVYAADYTLVDGLNSFYVQSVAKDGITKQQYIVNVVYDAPAAPAVKLSGTKAENLKAGAEVADIFVAGVEEDAVYTYELCEGNGDTNNDFFEIKDGKLVVKKALTDGEVYQIRVKAASGDSVLEEAFAITAQKLRVDYPVADLTAISDSQYLPGTANEGPDDYVVDGRPETHWHTNWQTEDGQNVDKRWIGVKLAEATEIDGIRYLPRTNGGSNGAVTTYKAQYRATDDGEWITLAEGTWSSSASDWQLITFAPVSAKQVRIIGVHTYADSGNDAHMSCAEFRVTIAEKEEVTPTPEVTEAPQPTETEAPQPTETEAPQPTETEAPQPTETPDTKEDVTTVFDDVYKDWYTDYVQYVYDNNLMTGIKGTKHFAPNANITKAQVAQVLYNMEDQPEVTDLKVFKELNDVYSAEWYANAVAWAYNNGVVTGDLNTKKFNPNADVTREQLALMMFRYAQFKKYDTSATTDYAGLVNADKVNNWAADGVKWAVGAGLISGIEKDGVKDLAPQGNASRAQVAAILQRFCENVK